MPTVRDATISTFTDQILNILHQLENWIKVSLNLKNIL